MSRKYKEDVKHLEAQLAYIDKAHELGYTHALAWKPAEPDKRNGFYFFNEEANKRSRWAYAAGYAEGVTEREAIEARRRELSGCCCPPKATGGPVSAGGTFHLNERDTWWNVIPKDRPDSGTGPT